MAAAETFSNRPSTQVPAGADAPASGAVETWTVTSSASFPAAATGASQFHVTDTVATTEIILVTNVSGTTWTVTRGAENTVPVAHQPGFVIYQVMTAGWLNTIATVPVTVPAGGTGGTALTAYALLAGGTATASPVQQVPGLGTTGYVLTSGGAGSLPTWQPSAGGSGGVQLAGDLGGGSAVPQVISTHFPVVTSASASGTVNLDPTSTRVFSLTETGNCALTFNPAGSLGAGTAYSFELWLYQDGTGGRSTAFPASVSWVGGTAPALNTAGSALNLMVFESLNAGTAWTGSLVTEAPAFPLTVVNGGTGLGAAGSAGTFFTSQGATTPGAWAGLLPAGTVQTGSFTATLGQLNPVSAVSASGGTATLPGGQFAGQLVAVKMTATAPSGGTAFIKPTAPDIIGRSYGWTSGAYSPSASLTLPSQGQLMTYTPAGAAWPVTATAGTAAMTILTSPAPFAAGQLAFFTAGSAPSGLSVNTPYYVTSLTGPAGGTVSFQVGTASTGPAITPATTGSGVQVQACGNWTTVADDLPLSQLQALFLPAAGTAVTANALNSATTTVNVAAATAPTAGQILTATSGTAAAWQTPSPGFASPMTTGGDMIFESGALAAARLGGNTGSTKNFLTSTGSGGTASAPAWGTIAGTDLPVISGQYLCPPAQYAPGSQVTLTTNSGTMSAVSSANVNTGSFIAPPSGDVITTASFTFGSSSASDEVAFGLALHGTTAMQGYSSQVKAANATQQCTVIPFLVTGLTAGSAYTFDLMFCIGLAGTLTVYVNGQTAATPTLAGTAQGGPVVMTVQAV